MVRFMRPYVTVLVNLILALIVFANAEFGKMLGIPGQTLQISVVWPATGFSLAALLLFGLTVSPGIFIGNLAYNLLHLFSTPLYALGALIISLGSFIQAIVGYKIMRKYASPNYFTSVKDVTVFLLPAGLLTCLIASTIGTVTLYLLAPMPLDRVLQTWATFWVGDTMGVYVFTPLLVVWTAFKLDINLKKRWMEIASLLFLILGVSYATSIKGPLLAHLYIPLSLWGAYRFKMQGATLTTLFILLAILLPMTLDYGPFSATSQDILMNVISFLEMTAALALIVAALVYERNLAYDRLQSTSLGLKHSVEMGLEKLQEKDAEIFAKEKLATHDTLTSNIAKQIQEPLKRIDALTKVSLDDLSELAQILSPFQEKLAPEVYENIEMHRSRLENYLSHIAKHEKQASHISDALRDYSDLSTPFEIKSIDINALLELCLNHAIRYGLATYPSLEVDFIQDFDKAVFLKVAIPRDLAKVLYHLLVYSIDSLSLKEGKDFIPTLKIGTLNLDNKVIITLNDNGQGLGASKLKKGFSLSEKTLLESRDFPLAIAHDLVTDLYKGEFKIVSVEGAFTEITLILPKFTHPKN